ncbi:efflux RND transporter periplasmic adaptor subunit [Kaistia dalseonensis]|uniref:HlyD family secretion protein n=1 Tax=Kaistia dalseonensis TaxID=410840 RepID=A0ABU0H370_9HYPH|nr:efflux RND transporter periplasmic adaptor subunit [Kaistia dalseonensis]MCX5494165.1 efflux RND transporter periplasmic adaptor subunit [Kaistia dalseonensis]MDQ0436744.1 HlyD family secretion protein [Kaistia dalseonensis]
MSRVTDEMPNGGASQTAQKLQAILGDVATTKRSRRGGKALWIALAAVVLAGLVGWWFYASSTSGGYNYTTEKVTRGDLTVTVTATGSVQPIEQVDVSSELSGRVKTVNVDYNSAVKTGDVLAELVTDSLEVTVQSARAKLASAQANVAKAHAAIAAANSTVESKKVLVGRNVSSSQELLDAQAAYDSAVAAEQAANADVLAAQADLQLAETNLSKAKILSPIDGIVLTRDVDPGSTVAASLSAPVLFKIAGDLRQMELQVDVDEADVGQVAIGQKASFTVDAYPEQTFPAAIKDIRFVSETTDNVVTYKALLSVDNAKLLLRPGMTATADITVEQVKSALLIPNAALRYSPPVEAKASTGLFSLFRPPNSGAGTTPEPKGRARTVWVMRNKVPTPISVEIGSTDGQHTALVSGDLAEGDELIVDATARSS